MLGWLSIGWPDYNSHCRLFEVILCGQSSVSAESSASGEQPGRRFGYKIWSSLGALSSRFCLSGAVFSPETSHANVTCVLAGSPLDEVFRKREEGLLCLRRAHPVCGPRKLFDKPVDSE
jgi:hypothetical protein